MSSLYIITYNFGVALAMAFIKDIYSEYESHVLKALP